MMGKNQEISVETIVDKTKYFETCVKDKIGRDIVLVIGNTRSGKTTFMNILAGKKIVIKDKGVGNGLGFFIDTEDQKYAGEISSKDFEMAIGHGTDACSKYPNYVNVKDIQFWDCPGFFDNRGAEYEICSATYLHILLGSAITSGTGLKFIVLEDYYGIYEGGKNFKNSIQTLCKIFAPESDEDYKALIDATTFVFNKVPSETLLETDDKTEFLSGYLKMITSSIELEDQTSEMKACSTFIDIMKKVVENVNHVGIPEAFYDSNETDFTKPILGVDGVFSRVEHAPALKDSKPKLIVSKGLFVDILKVHEYYQSELDKHETPLLPLLTRALEESGDQSALTTLSKVILLTKPDQSKLKRGGATRLTLELVECLEQLKCSEGLKETLSSVREKIYWMVCFGDLIGSCIGGARCSSIVKTIIIAANNHAGELELKNLRHSNKLLDERISELNHIDPALSAQELQRGSSWYVLWSVSDFIQNYFLGRPSRQIVRSAKSSASTINAQNPNSIEAEVSNLCRDNSLALPGELGDITLPNSSSVDQIRDIRRILSSCEEQL